MRTASMPARFNWAKLLILLLCIISCASCAPRPQTCIQCFLSCDGASELKKHESVIVSIEPPLQKDSVKLYNVSSFYDGEHCSVPGCFQSDTPHALKIYAIYNTVPEILFNKTNLSPVCGPERISDRKNPNDANGKVSNRLLILLTFYFWLIFHLEGPR